VLIAPPSHKREGTAIAIACQTFLPTNLIHNSSA
jgi:hypothetical protein